MRCIIYKSLDKSSSLFGIKGSYLYYAIVGAGADVLLSLVVGSLTNGLVGMIVFILLLVAVYVAVLRVQAKFSERERARWFCSHRLPDYIKVPPKRLSSCVMATFESKDEKKQ